LKAQVYIQKREAELLKKKLEAEKAAKEKADKKKVGCPAASSHKTLQH
jgi:hypothetical protein